MAINTVKLMFDGELQECLVRESATETVCYARDGQFVKFNANVDLKTAVADHNKANAEKPIFAEAANAADNELSAWFDGA